MSATIYGCPDGFYGYRHGYCCSASLRNDYTTVGLDVLCKTHAGEGKCSELNTQRRAEAMNCGFCSDRRFCCCAPDRPAEPGNCIGDTTDSKDTNLAGERRTMVTGEQGQALRRRKALAEEDNIQKVTGRVLKSAAGHSLARLTVKRVGRGPFSPWILRLCPRWCLRHSPDAFCWRRLFMGKKRKLR